MKYNPELKRQRFREGLYQAFSAEGRTGNECQTLTQKFDLLTDGGMTGEGAMGIIYAAYGSSDPKKVCRTISDWVNSELEQFAATHKGIDRNPITRLRDYAKRLNEKIDQVCITVDGKELSKEELSRVKIRLPGCLNPPVTYSAAGSAKGKTAVFELDVSK